MKIAVAHRLDHRRHSVGSLLPTVLQGLLYIMQRDRRKGHQIGEARVFQGMNGLDQIIDIIEER